MRKRLIDADAIEYKESTIDTVYRSTDDVIVWHEKRTLKWVSKEDIDKMPTIESEPFIHCKNCKYWKQVYGWNAQNYKKCICLERDTNAYFYCAYGEKKNEEERDKGESNN